MQVFILDRTKCCPKYTEVSITETMLVDDGDNMNTDTGYVFKNIRSGLYLSIEDSVAAAGTNVIQTDSYTIDASIWSLSYAGDGYYYIISHLGDGQTYYLDLDYGLVENGMNIGIYTNTYSDAQLFKFIENEDGSYSIATKNTADNSCLAVEDDSNSDGASILQWEISDTDYQHWWAVESTIKVSSTVDTGYTYMIKNYNSGLYMDIDGGTKVDGTNVQQWGADSSASYNTWALVSAGNGYYYIISLLGDGQTWYLTVDDGSSTSGTNVAIYTNDGTSAQLFKFVENSNGTYTIYTKSSKDTCCLEVVDYSTASGANIVQATSDSGSNQYWILEKIDSIEVVKLLHRLKPPLPQRLL